MEDRKDLAVDESRRSAVRKMAYAVPVVLTLAASASFARAGSGENAQTETTATPLRETSEYRAQVPAIASCGDARLKAAAAPPAAAFVCPHCVPPRALRRRAAG